MRIVADTGPLNDLIQIEAIGVLEHLFTEVLIPEGVVMELMAEAAPVAVRDWALNLPIWCSVHPASDNPLPAFSGLSPVDLDVLALAQANQEAVLLDDLAARNAAKQLGLKVIGTLGVLELAATRKWVNLSETIALLKQTNIRISDQLYSAALARAPRS
jgi:predicted nucleic acid-binding protein